MPGFHLYVSNRLEILRDYLAEVVAVPLPSPLGTEVIVVQSGGMERWLSRELAGEFGIWANCRFPFPNYFIQDVFRSVLGGGPEDTVFSPELMTWRVMKILPSCLPGDGFESLRNYLGEGGGDLKRFQLCARIADTFDQYTVYRPEMLKEWESGKGSDWQPRLWRELVAGHRGEHRAAVRAAFFASLPGKAGAEGLFPARVSIFGIPSLPLFHLDVFAALSEHTDVHLFFLNPTREYWGDLVSQREMARRKVREERDGGPIHREDHYEAGNPLLASLGRLGRDFFETLVERELGVGNDHVRFEDPVEDTLLSCVQSDLLNLANRGKSTPKKTLAAGDRSLLVHSCHGPLREMEVLHDHLLDLFEREPGLSPGDVLVMTPDIEAYAPYISAVFGGGPGAKIPYSVADRSARSESHVVKAFMAILGLSGSRLGVTQVLSILDSPVVQSRFGLSAQDVETVLRWIDDTRIRWGMDGGDRAGKGVFPFEENSWRYGLDRLFLGYAMDGGEGAPFAGIVPCEGPEGSDAQVLGRFAEFLRRLFLQARRLEEPRTLSGWSEELLGLQSGFIASDEETESEFQLVRRCVVSLREKQERSGFDEPVGVEAVRRDLEAGLGRHEIAPGFLSGGVTFCEMLPMRSIPFQAIALVGMNSGAFPRRNRPLQFDMIAGNPRRGDRSLRDEDRYLFLEAVLSARKRLHISYVGQSAADNNEIPPSVLVSELIDYVEQGFEAQPGEGGILDRVVVRHRLQAFSPDYFTGKGPLFSYSEENFDALAARRRAGRRPAPFVASPLAPPPDEWKTIGVGELVRFYRNPARFFLRRRLGIFLEEMAPEPEDREPFLLDSLEKYELKQRLASRMLGGEDPSDIYPLERGRGILPAGRVGEAVFENVSREVREFVRRASAGLSGRPAPPLSIGIEIEGFRLSGAIEGIRENRLVRHRCARVTPGDLVGIWVEHIAMLCSGVEGHPRGSLLIGQDETWELPQVGNAMEILAGLVTRYWEGLSEPLRFFPKASMEYAAGIAAGKDPVLCLRAAARAWRGSEFGGSPGEGEDPSVSLCFGNGDPFGGPFAPLATSLLGPLLGCAAKARP